MIIKTAAALADLAGELKQLGSFSLDTEFIREKTYRPQLCLVQIAAAEKCVLVDPFLTSDLTPLLDLVADPEVEKVLHAGEQDMEIFFALGRRVPRNVFDTQVASALAGRGESISYARMVEDLVGIKLSKVETFTDWAKRPLSPQQIDYAMDDVRYLLPAKQAVLRELETLGRLEWLPDELQFYEETTLYEKDTRRLYLKVRSAARLAPRELAVLRELAAWREEEARRMDWPRGRILLDEALVELARRAPSGLESISAVRGIHPQLVKRCGAEILKRVEAGRRLPEADCPSPIERRSEDADLAAVVDLLEVVLRALAAEAKVAPAYIASRKDLTELARRELRAPKSVEEDPLPAMTGWRRRIAGEALLAVLRGRCQVGVDAAQAKLEVSRKP